MFWKYYFSTLLVFEVTLGIASASCSSDDYPERRQDLQQYQDSSQCFPITETWYLLFRNYEEDPALGGKAKCVRATQTGPVEDDAVTLHVEYSPDGSMEGKAMLKSLEGYDAKNLLELTVGGDTEPLQTTVAFGLCDTCIVSRQLYITNAPGPACSVWVPESRVDDVSMCCTFLFDLLCGTTEKYYMYDESCKSEA